MEATLGLLRDLYFFRSLSQDELAKVAAVCREEHFSARDMICSEGSPADRFFIILDGTVEVWKDWGDPEADLLAVHGPGHLFGEMALIDEMPRSATVIARNPVRVLSIGRQDFHRIITENASVALSVMRSVSSMVRVSNDKFVESLRKRNRELVKTNRQLKNTQSRLLRAERLSVLGRFSTLILHDIRNPISILRGFAEMILPHSGDAELVARNVRRIIAEADRLNRISGELLDFSRGEISLNMSIVDLGELVGRVMEIEAERFASRKIEIKDRHRVPRARDPRFRPHAPRAAQPHGQFAKGDAPRRLVRDFGHARGRKSRRSRSPTRGRGWTRKSRTDSSSHSILPPGREARGWACPSSRASWTRTKDPLFFQPEETTERRFGSPFRSRVEPYGPTSGASQGACSARAERAGHGCSGAIQGCRAARRHLTICACSITYLPYTIPGSVTVAQKTLDLFVGVRILPGKDFRDVREKSGPFVYRLGHEILNLKRGVRFP